MADPRDAEVKQFVAQVGESLDRDAEMRERRRLNQTAWKDLTIEQKFDRMREVIKQFERSSQYHSQRIQDVTSHLAALDEHAHVDGKVVIPVVGAHRQPGYGAEIQAEKVEGWF